MVNVENFFDLYDIFVNELVGGIWLFIAIALIAIVFLSLKNKIPSEAIFLIVALFISLMYAATGEALTLLWVLVVLAAGIIFYLKFVKIGKG